MYDIDAALAKSPVKEGDEVRVKSTGKIGVVHYVYYNGFALVKIPGEKVTGGMFNNDGTHAWDELELVKSK